MTAPAARFGSPREVSRCRTADRTRGIAEGDLSPLVLDIDPETANGAVGRDAQKPVLERGPVGRSMIGPPAADQLFPMAMLAMVARSRKARSELSDRRRTRGTYR